MQDKLCNDGYILKTDLNIVIDVCDTIFNAALFFDM
jgi:hypothetical protein